MISYKQLTEIVHSYHTVKAKAKKKPIPVDSEEWLSSDLKHLLEEVGELIEAINLNRPYISSAREREEIADVAINLACIADYYGVDILLAMDEKLAILKERMENMGSCKEER